MQPPLERRRASSRAGFTLIEAAFVVVILGALLGGMATAARESGDVYRNSMTVLELELRARRALSRVLEELATASLDTMIPSPETPEGVSDVTFNQVTGFAAGALTLGGATRLAFEYDTGEVNDGVDNDGDGLVDEGVLVLVRDAGTPDQIRLVLARNVSEVLEGELQNGADDNGNGFRDEPGFHLSRDGAALTIRITLESLNPQGDREQRTLWTTIRSRNGT